MYMHFSIKINIRERQPVNTETTDVLYVSRRIMSSNCDLYLYVSRRIMSSNCDLYDIVIHTIKYAV